MKFEIGDIVVQNTAYGSCHADKGQTVKIIDRREDVVDPGGYFRVGCITYRRPAQKDQKSYWVIAGALDKL